MTAASKTFPSAYWEPRMHSHLGLIHFLEHAPWKDLVTPPPPEGSPQFAAELEELMRKQRDTAERGRRTPEILAENDQPPVAFQRLLLFNERSHPQTHALVFGAMILLGRCVVMHYKNAFNRARPSQYLPYLRPLLEVPGHPAYPSGHSTQMHLIAHALSDVVPGDLMRPGVFDIAWRVAENREWAGLHYRSDSEAGRCLAQKIFPFAQESFRDTFDQARLEWPR